MAKTKTINQASLTVLRIVLGIIFIYHGYQKLFVVGGLPGTVMFFSKIGIPLPNISAVVVAFAEFAGGILLLIGLSTRLASALLAFEMFVALFKVHLNNGFLVSKGGYEFVLLILAALAVIMLSGAGRFSLGRLFKNKYLH